MADQTVVQQIAREAPEIEAYKLKLLEQAQALAYNQRPKLDETGNVVRDATGNVVYEASPQTLAQQLPGYQVAGFSPAQIAAIQAAEQQGVGAFSPYMAAANQALGSAYGTTAEAADILRGADTRQQFTDAQLAMQQAGGAAAGITSGIPSLAQGLTTLDLAGQRALGADTTGQFGAAYGGIGQGIGALSTGQDLAARSSQADFAQSQGLLGQAAARAAAIQPDFSQATGVIGQGLGTGQQSIGMAQLAAQQPGFAEAQAALQRGIGVLGGATQRFQPTDTAAFMNPYQQQVIDETLRQINRQGDIARQGLAAQAVRAGAFGGTREGVQRAELERNLSEQRNNTIANLLSQGYTQAQAQAMASFEQQQMRQMQTGQGIGQLGAQFGQIASQQGSLGQQAAQIAAQQAALGVQAGSQLGSLEAQKAQLGLASAGQLANIGQTYGQQAVQQAQLGQSAAGLYNQAAQQYGNLASQQGALAGQESAINQNIANLLAQQAGQYGQMGSQIANIYGQQAQQFQNLGQGIGQLAGQQFGIGQQQAAGLGALAGQLGQLGVQQGALGQTAQALQQGDINFLYNVGQAQQAFNQQTLDAQRATELQKIYAPYQQAGFLSDIYKGAPSTQMSTQVASQPTASPFQQAVGIGLASLATVAGAKKAGLFG